MKYALQIGFWEFASACAFQRGTREGAVLQAYPARASQLGCCDAIVCQVLLVLWGCHTPRVYFKQPGQQPAGGLATGQLSKQHAQRTTRKLRTAQVQLHFVSHWQPQAFWPLLRDIGSRDSKVASGSARHPGKSWKPLRVAVSTECDLSYFLAPRGFEGLTTESVASEGRPAADRARL